MKRSSFTLILIALLLLGGFLTVQILATGSSGALPGLRIQTLDKGSSTLAVGPGQAVAFIIFVLFTLGSLVIGGAALAFLLRYLDRQTSEAKQDDQ